MITQTFGAETVRLTTPKSGNGSRVVRNIVRRAAILFTAIATAGALSPALAEDGYDLWLRYAPLEEAPKAFFSELLQGTSEEIQIGSKTERFEGLIPQLKIYTLRDEAAKFNMSSACSSVISVLSVSTTVSVKGIGKAPALIIVCAASFHS